MNSKKKILLLSTGDVNGGYEAIYRIACFLKEAGYEVAMVVKTKNQRNPIVFQYPNQSLVKRVIIKLKEKFLFSNKRTHIKYLFLADENEKNQYTSGKDILSIIPFMPDLVISGMTNGFTNTRTLVEIYEKTKAKIFLVTIDMSPLTGGCHFAWDCKGYETDCNNCPAILDEKNKNWPAHNYAIKKKNIKQANIKILAGSGWTQHQARLSGLYKHQDIIHNINSCIDTRLFNSKHRGIAKSIFGIEENCKLIFCGAQNMDDTRKGFSYFIESLEYLYNSLNEQQRSSIVILVISRKLDEETANKIPFKTHILDYVNDYRLLSLVYQATDIFVGSSIEDSGPMMVSEALACGTPVVGFDMGIVNNMVVNDYNGYKVELKNSREMAMAMKKILNLSTEAFAVFSGNATRQVELYSSSDKVLEVIDIILNEN